MAIIDPLVSDMLAWLAAAPRPYGEVMEVWRTSCPRLTVWEDAVDGGFVERVRDDQARRPVVRLTALGRLRLEQASRR